ncbi:hypothetical protein LINPERPRIM_LOCUS35947 [Linum perenne]
MKSVTGKINSVTPVSVTRAASILSNFVDADTGASQAVTAYLRRATAAFNELVQFHSKSHERRYEKHKSDITEAAGPTTSFANTVDDEPTQRIAQSKPPTTAERNEQDSNDNNNKKKKKSKNKSVVIEEEQRKGEGNVEVEEESVNKKKKKKKKKSRDEKNEGLYVKGEEAVNPDANLGDLGRESDEQRKNKSKTKENGNRENGGSIGNHEGTDDKRSIKKEEEKSELLKVKDENRKKRKSSEAEEERRDDQSEERPRKKSK